MDLGNRLQIGSLYFAEGNYKKFSAVVTVCPSKPNWCKYYDKQLEDIQLDEHIDDSIHHLIVPCDDIPEEPIYLHFDTVNKFVDKHINTGDILFHCLAGISRSSSFCLAYYMYKTKCGYANSINLLRRVYINAHPNEGFVQQLLLYEKYKWSISNYDQFKLDIKSYSNDIIKSNSDESDGSNVVYNCRKCRVPLFYEKNVWNHIPKEDKYCHSVFIEPMDWMNDLDQQSGKLFCKNEKCLAKLGSFIWHGNKCNCGYRQIPSFQIHLSRVDKIPLCDAFKLKGENP